MAHRSDAHPHNVPGPYFVDRTCIDCGTCYQLAPDTFAEGDDHARVYAQPETPAARRLAAMALVACPVGSIGTDDRSDVPEATRAFPHPLTEGVSFCGYTSDKSFGAWSYLIERPGGHVLVDAPRAAEPLMANLEARGGLALMVLTHRDDVADHAAYQARFGCQRVIHRDEGIAGLEQYVEGHEPLALAPDLWLIPTPGHTAGSVCLLHREVLFTGDHLWWNPGLGRLSASREFNWHSWERQLGSIERLLSFEFRWVMPGHGALYQAASPQAMRDEVARALGVLRGS